MSLTKFLTSKIFLKHLFIAIVVLILLLVMVVQGLKIYTNHGESLPVPDFYGLSTTEIKTTANENSLRYKIIDSTHIKGAAPGSVVDQFPEAGFKVKENRTIFLTINSNTPEKVILPKLTDISFRQAQVLINNCGLKMGNISYKPSEYNNLVLAVEQDSIEVSQGDMLLKGSNVDLIIGRDAGNAQTLLPDLMGLTAEEAKEVIMNALLNPGVIIFDASIENAEDSINAVVWKQYPNSKITRDVNLGTSVDLWITVDSLKLQLLMPADTIQVDF